MDAESLCHNSCVVRRQWLHRRYEAWIDSTLAAVVGPSAIVALVALIATFDRLFLLLALAVVATALGCAALLEEKKHLEPFSFCRIGHATPVPALAQDPR